MKGSLLLVEDDDVTREILAAVLRNAGHTVTTAANGSIAIQLLQAQPFDVVLSDIRMRDIDGIEVLNAARQLATPPEVILLTGYGSLETAVAALRAGAFNYLMKPCASADLLGYVDSALEHHAKILRQRAAAQLLIAEFALQPSLAHEGSILALPEPPQPPSSVTSAPTAADAGRFLRVGSLALDLYRHSASFANQPLQLTPTEFIMLRTLAETPEKVIRCSEIVRQTHGHVMSESEAQTLLRTHVRNLRRKLPPTYLITVRSSGYMLIDPAERTLSEATNFESDDLDLS